MADVKRYTFRENGQPWMKYAILLPDDSIQYVRAEDYDSLRASHGELLEFIKSELRERLTECDCGTCFYCDYTKDMSEAIANAEKL